MEQFEQLLTCAICLDRYRNPKLLPCQHSFCMEPCMEGLVDYVRRQVKCPECRAEHRIPYNGIQGFPTNVTLTRFLELHMDITGELPDPTAGQLMERCAVCSEKSYCNLCVHCDKKVCTDCKDAHEDILKREISRINNQIHRGIHRLHNALGIVEKNSLHLQQICVGVTEEIEEIYRRLSKALRDRSENLKGEIERFLAVEIRNLSTFKENLTQEISNIESNSELAEKHMQDDTEWDDCELMDAKDIFLRTMEFIRNFDYDPGDYGRRVRFAKTESINELANTLSSFGELNINELPKFGNAKEQQTLGLNSGPGLMRSKSDHRLVTQFRQQQEERGIYGSTYGGENEGGRLSPVASRRQFGERFGSKDKYGHELSPRYSAGNEYGSSGVDNPYETPSENRRSRFRSRFTRHLDADSDNEPQGRSVRFKDEHDERVPKKERERVLDTEDVAKGPLSGITRLIDSPRVIQKLQDNELREKKKEKIAKMPPAPAPMPAPPVTQPVVPKRAQRQVSEEDEIAKIKKQNRAQEKTESAAAASPSLSQSTPAPVVEAPTVTPKPLSERMAALREEPRSTTESLKQRKASVSSEPTSPISEHSPPRQTSVTREKQEEANSADRDEMPHAAANRRRTAFSGGRSQSDAQFNYPSTNLPHPSGLGTEGKDESESDSLHNKVHKPSSKSSTVQPPYSRSSSSSSLNIGDAETRTRSPRPTRVSLPDKFKSRDSSTDSSTSTGSSAASSPVRNTGAAFSAEEIKQRYLNNTTAAAVTKARPHAPAENRESGGSTSRNSRFSGTAASRGNASDRRDEPLTPSTQTPRTGASRFQSRFLGRAATPTVEASKESESSSDDTSSSDSESEDEPITTREKPRNLERDDGFKTTSIGPLLARSAQVRDTGSKTKKDDPSVHAYSKSKTSALATPSGAYGADRNKDTTSSRFGTRMADRSGTGSKYGVRGNEREEATSSRLNTRDSEHDYGASGLSRSRTGSLFDKDNAERYPLSSKYLNRSRANMRDDKDSTLSGKKPYSSRFLNKSKSSAALAPDKEDPEENQPVRKISGDERYPSGRSRCAALKDRRSRLARSRSSHDCTAAEDDVSPEDSKDTGSPSYNSMYGTASDVSRSCSTRAMKSRDNSPEKTDKDQGSASSLSTWARYLKNKYAGRNKEKNEENKLSSRRKSNLRLGINKRHSLESSDDDQRNIPNSPISSSTGTGFGSLSKNQYLQKKRLLLKIGSRGSDPSCFTWPRGVAIGPDNTIVVADSSNHRVQVFDHSGTFLKQFGQYGNTEGEFDCLAGVAVNRIGQYIIADRYNHRIQIFDPSGRFLRAFGSQGSVDGRFSYPWGITTDALGFIYVCDKENHRVQVFQSDGTFVGKFGSLGSKPGQLEHPHYIAVSNTNRVIVSDSNNHRIQIFDVNGRVLTTFGSEGTDDGQFKFPRGVAVDDQGFIFVGDSGNNRIQIFHPDGTFLRTFGCWGAGDGEFKGLEGIAVMSNGNILVCDRENHRIQVF